MLREIFEQPQALADTVLPRLTADHSAINIAGEIRIPVEELRRVKRINIVASGTSRHAGMVGQYMFQDLAHVPADVDYASEFEYRNPAIGAQEITIVITQSGETADTMAAQRLAKEKGSRTIAISNVVGSTIAREADGILYTHAGREVSIASTKAFTAQMAVLFLFAAYLGSVRGVLTDDAQRRWIEQLLALRAKSETVLQSADLCRRLAEKFQHASDFLFVGRAIHYPIAMDGALKLKEVSYVHAEGYPAGETKHGPNALIDENLPVVFLAAYDPDSPQSHQRYEKVLNNIKEVKSRDGIIVAVGNAGDADLSESADHFIEVATTNEFLLPILEVIPLQLLAYHCAVRRGCDIDQPRNLAKTVTVE